MTDHVRRIAQKKVNPYIGGVRLVGIKPTFTITSQNKKAVQNMYDLLIVNM